MSVYQQLITQNTSSSSIPQFTPKNKCLATTNSPRNKGNKDVTSKTKSDTNPQHKPAPDNWQRSVM
jgi:hypothetical protein